MKCLDLVLSCRYYAIMTETEINGMSEETFQIHKSVWWEMHCNIQIAFEALEQIRKDVPEMAHEIAGKFSLDDNISRE